MCLRRRRPAKARACTAAGSRNASRRAQSNTSSASGRLWGAESRRNQKDGAAWPRSLQLDLGCSLRRPATCQLAVHGSGPYVRAARQAGDRDKRSMHRRPRHSPAHLQFRAGVSPRLTSDRCAPRGRQKIPGIPISPRGPACSHPLTSSRHELMPFKRSEMERVWRMRKKGG